MLPKPRKVLKFPPSYRPIILLNLLSKVFKSLIQSRLKFHTMAKIGPEQHGFRNNHSTCNQLINVIDLLTTNANKKTKTVAVLLDVEIAIDKVWHRGLIHKLLNLDVPTHLVRFLMSFLDKRSFQVFPDSDPFLQGFLKGHVWLLTCSHFT